MGQIVGGHPANLNDFGAALSYKGAANDCTATIIGPETVIIAAHCVRNGAVGLISLPSGGYPATCKRSPDFDGSHYDVALCSTTTPIVLLNGATYERISIDPALPTIPGKLLLQGLGCRAVGASGKTSYLSEGDANITNPGDLYGEITTIGGVAVCSGDSGGPAYLKSQDGKSRVMVGINMLSHPDLSSTLV